MKKRLVAMLAVLVAALALPAGAQDAVSVIELVRQSQSALAAHRMDDAVSLARQAVNQDPAYGDAWRQLGAVLLRMGSRGEALEAFEAATRLTPDNAAAWRDYGWTLWAENRRDEAVKAFEQAVALNVPQKEDLAVQVLAALSEQGRTDEALEVFNRWVPGGGVLAPAIKLVEKGRTVAARPLLERAWAAGENKPLSGLYLAYANALNGSCESTYEHLSPFLDTVSQQTDPALLDMSLEALNVCSDNARLQDALERMGTAIEGRPAQSARITDIMEKAAEEQRFRGDERRALELYERVLARDPARVSWIFAAGLKESLEGEDAATAMLNDLLRKTKSAAVKNGIEGRAAERAGKLETAAKLYQKSLADEPAQPLLRENRFKVLVKLGRLKDAREEAEWFAKRIEEGDPTLRSYLAEMWTSLAEDEKALDLWQMLHLSLPDLPYYAVETALAMFRLCQPEDAIAVLESTASLTAYPLAYEFLAEIEAALGRPAEAMKRAEEGLEKKQTRGLLRQHAENAETAGLVSEASVASSAAYLELDPGNSSMALLHGRQLWALGLTNEATAHFKELVARNPALVPALLFLRDSASLRRRFKEAAQYSAAAAKVIPSSVDIQRRYAVSLAEYERWHRAFSRLRKTASQDASQAIAVLMYRLVTDCDYPGRNNVSQIAEHVERLAGAGYAFTLPADVNRRSDRPRAMLILLDADLNAVEKIDEVLKNSNARAVYAGTTTTLTRESPGKPTPAQLAKLVASGRWAVASSGPDENASVAVTAEGNLGNPLTHSVFVRGVEEDPVAYSNRIDNTIAAAAASLDPSAARMLVYPGGDFGQTSLDTGFRQLDALQAAVKKHFNHAVYAEDPGFVPPNHDDVRLPGRMVPPDWDGERLMDHMVRANPVVRAQLELAKLLYWNRQHEAANVWFARLDKAGADPREILYNWGANAYQQGDLPVALEKLRAARDLQPDDEKIASALKRAENVKRPDISGGYLHWYDNESRSYEQWNAEAQGFVTDRLRLGAFADRNRWEQDALGVEEGDRAGVQALIFPHRAIWLEARVWRLWMDDLPDRDGRLIRLRLPNTLLSGFVAFVAAREEMETVEALRADIYQNRFAVQTYSRLLDVWDLYANLTRLERTDDNETTIIDGRLVYRLHEWPFLGAGYLFRFGDSDFDPPEYWAPEELEQHQFYATWRGDYRRLNFSFSGQAGVAREMETDWRFVWGARANADLRLTRHLGLRGEVNYFEGPIYERTTWTAGATAKF